MMTTRGGLLSAAALLLVWLCTAPSQAALPPANTHALLNSQWAKDLNEQVQEHAVAQSATDIAATAQQGKPSHGTTQQPVDPGQLAPNHAGYIPLELDAALYYAYYEAQNSSIPERHRPILLWLQGGPGCASTFGLMYELGPLRVQDNLQLVQNPGAWNRMFGLLIVDQPIGTGYSKAGSKPLPGDTLQAAADLYQGLLGFFDAHPELQDRPFIITGESYAGKYVPSTVHYILQASQYHQQQEQQQQQQRQQPRYLLRPPLKEHRQLPPAVRPPNFRLAGAAIGNGFTDPRTQTLAFAESAYGLGLVPPVLQSAIATRQGVVVGLVDEGQWRQAREAREKLLEYIAKVSGAATPLDVRRTQDYDAAKAVDRLLNRTDIKAIMKADPQVSYEGCSEAVGDAMAGDMMRGVRPLVADILHHLPLLLYQGQFDAQDGVVSNNAWIKLLYWHGNYGYDWFDYVHPRLWHVDGVPAGWKRNVTTLTQVMVRNAGHMVPADQPRAAQAMMEEWVQQVAADLLPSMAAAEAA